MSLFPSTFSFDNENICQPLKTMSDHIVKLLKDHQNCVSSTLLSVFGNVFRQSFVFDYYFSTVLNNFGGSLSEKQEKHLLFFFIFFLFLYLALVTYWNNTTQQCTTSLLAIRAATALVMD